MLPLRIQHAWLIATLISCIIQPFAYATVALSTNFDSASIQSYGNNTVINAGGSVEDNLTARAIASDVIAVVDAGSGNRKLHLSKTATGWADGLPLLKKVFTPMSTTSAGENFLVGEFNLIRLNNGTNCPTIELMIQSDQQEILSSSYTIVDFWVKGDGSVCYNNGSISIDSGYDISANVEYRITINLDLSSATQDTWSFSIALASNPSTPLLQIGDIDTRVANGSADIIIFRGGRYSTSSWPTAFAALDNLYFESFDSPVFLTTSFETNLDNAATGSYANLTNINSGGSTSDDILVHSDADTEISVVNLGSGNRGLTLTKPSTGWFDGAPAIEISFPAVDTGLTGEPYFMAEMDLTKLSTNSTDPMTQIFINQSNDFFGGSSTTIVEARIRSDGELQYRDGNNIISTGFILQANQNYRLTISGNLSSNTQDSYTIAIASTNDPSNILYQHSDALTRVANGAPDTLVIRGGGDANKNNPNSYLRVDNLYVGTSPVPIPVPLTTGAPDSVLWQIGNDDVSFAEFTGAQPSTYAIPSDWQSRVEQNDSWPDFTPNIRAYRNTPINITYDLSTVPANGVEFSFRAMDVWRIVPQLAVFSNGIPAGIIQTWGEGGISNIDYNYSRIYRLYIPKEMLQEGSNTLRLDIAPQIYSSTTDLQFISWDYLRLTALGSPAQEPIHGAVVYAGTNIMHQADGSDAFIIDQDTVDHAQTLLEWMGIAYSGNTMRAGFWTDVDDETTHKMELLERYRDLNMRVIVDYQNLLQVTMVNGDLSTQDKANISTFFNTYQNLFQFIELANEPGHIGNIPKANILAYGNYIQQIRPSHVKIVAPGWAYSNWAANVSDRQEVEALCDYLGGHAYGLSFNTSPGGSFVETLKSTGSVDDGFPKPLIATEFGSNEWHFDWDDPSSSQTHAAAFDRIMRAHISVAEHFMQHATHFNHVNSTYEKFSLFKDINWATHDPEDSEMWPGISGEDPRLQTYRRLALAYCTHGRPLPYEYLNNVTNQLVYFRAVDTSALPALPGSGATSNKVLLNFVNFSNQSQTLEVQVTFPSAKTYTGKRIGSGTIYHNAASAVSINATPHATLEVTLPPRDSVQYILE